MDALPFPLGTFELALNNADQPALKTYEGRCFTVPFIQPTVSPRSSIDRLSEHLITVMCVRNKSGNVLRTKRLVQLDVSADGAPCLRNVAGYANTAMAPRCVAVDPHLGTKDIPANALFWVVVGGMTYLKGSATQADWGGDIARGNPLVSAATGTDANDHAGGRPANPTIRTDTIANAVADMKLLDEAKFGWALQSVAAAGGSAAESDILVYMTCPFLTNGTV